MPHRRPPRGFVDAAGGARLLENGLASFQPQKRFRNRADTRNGSEISTHSASRRDGTGGGGGGGIQRYGRLADGAAPNRGERALAYCGQVHLPRSPPIIRQSDQHKSDLIFDGYVRLVHTLSLTISMSPTPTSYDWGFDKRGGCGVSRINRLGAMEGQIAAIQAELAAERKAAEPLRQRVSGHRCSSV